MAEMAGSSDTADGRWMPLREAMAHLKKSERTIYRWINSGKLVCHPTAVPCEVWVGDSTADSTAPSSAERRSMGFDRADERVRSLERENGALSERVARLEAEVSRLHEKAEEQSERMLTRLMTQTERNGELQAQISLLRNGWMPPATFGDQGTTT
jgi:cell division protein FtsB